MSQFVTDMLRKVNDIRFSTDVDRTKLKELVDIINAVLLPRGWIGLDNDLALHVTYVSRAGVELVGRGPTALILNADFAWEYRPWNRTVICLKCRCGHMSIGEEIGCNHPEGIE